MKHSHLDTAIAEAQRFIDRARTLKAACTPAEPVRKLAGLDDYIQPNCPRESGALRRASMDLTRALADLRRRQA